MTDDVHPYRTEPDPLFADRLEGELLRRLGAPPNSTDQDRPEDVPLVGLVDPEQPAVEDERQSLRMRPRAGSRPWLVVAAAATVLIVAGVALLLQQARDGDQEPTPIDRPPAIPVPEIPVPLWVDLPAGSTVALPPPPGSGNDGGGGIWTGMELIVWREPAAPDASPPAEGAAFNPETGTWRMIAPAPIGSGSPVAWTGREMIVWGGHGADGAAYDPEADTWRLLPDAPISASDATAVWTGDEVIVLGGFDDRLDAAAYDPATDEWRALADANGYLVSGAVWTGTSVLTVLDVLGPPLTGPSYHRLDGGRGQRLARYDLSTDTWRIDADARYASLVGVPDADGVTRTILAVPVEPGEPVDLLDAAGTPIDSLPAHPVDLGGSTTAAAGIWLGEEAVFSIDSVDDWLFPSPEAWALDAVAGTWRRLPGDVPILGAAVAVGDVVLGSDGDRPIAYRIRTSASD